MCKLKISDMAAFEERKFTAGDLSNSAMILITNITESNIGSAITAAKQAESSRAVTAGILPGNINLLNQNMKRLSDIADAVILSPGKIEDFSRRIIDAISDLVTKFGFVNSEFEDVKEILKNAGTVYFGTGTAKSI